MSKCPICLGSGGKRNGHKVTACEYCMGKGVLEYRYIDQEKALIWLDTQIRFYDKEANQPSLLPNRYSEGMRDMAMSMRRQVLKGEFNKNYHLIQPIKTFKD